MSQEGLDEPDIGSGLMEMRGEGMAKAMERDLFFDACLCHGMVENGTYRRTADGTIGVLTGE